MRIFFGIEAQISTYSINNSRKRIEELLGDIEVSDYTQNLDTIGIIINCFDKEWCAKGYGKTRKYISYIKRNADIRINIPAEEFLVASEKERDIMVLNNIIESITVINERLNKKNGCSFDGEKLIDYIKEKTIVLTK